MQPVRRTVRFLVIHLLALSLSMVALYPQLLLADGARKLRTQNQTRRACCGMVDSRCCGMACCAMQPTKSKSQDRTPPLQGSWSRLVLALQSSGSSAQSGASGSPLTSAASCFIAAHGQQSLQAEHVRLQI